VSPHVIVMTAFVVRRFVDRGLLLDSGFAH
jgi:hypothetical protein